MFSACQALKMHLSDEAALSSGELVRFVHYYQRESDSGSTCPACACARMSLDRCGGTPGPGCLQVRLSAKK